MIYTAIKYFWALIPIWLSNKPCFSRTGIEIVQIINPNHFFLASHVHQDHFLRSKIYLFWNFCRGILHINMLYFMLSVILLIDTQLKLKVQVCSESCSQLEDDLSLNQISSVLLSVSTILLQR